MNGRFWEAWIYYVSFPLTSALSLGERVKAMSRFEKLVRRRTQFSAGNSFTPALRKYFGNRYNASKVGREQSGDGVPQFGGITPSVGVGQSHVAGAAEFFFDDFGHAAGKIAAVGFNV